MSEKRSFSYFLIPEEAQAFVSRTKCLAFHALKAMIQSKFKIEDEQAEFLSNFKFYGYKDKSSLVRAALDRLKKELESNANPNAVELYAAMSEIAGAMESEDAPE